MGGIADRTRDDGPGQGEGVCRGSDSGGGGCGGGGGGAASVVTTQHREGYYTGGSRPEKSRLSKVAPTHLVLFSRHY